MVSVSIELWAFYNKRWCCSIWPRNKERYNNPKERKNTSIELININIEHVLFLILLKFYFLSFLDPALYLYPSLFLRNPKLPFFQFLFISLFSVKQTSHSFFSGGFLSSNYALYSLVLPKGISFPLGSVNLIYV